MTWSDRAHKPWVPLTRIYWHSHCSPTDNSAEGVPWPGFKWERRRAVAKWGHVPVTSHLLRTRWDRAGHMAAPWGEPCPAGSSVGRDVGGSWLTAASLPAAAVCGTVASALQWVALSAPESCLTEVSPSGMRVLVFPFLVAFCFFPGSVKTKPAIEQH